MASHAKVETLPVPTGNGAVVLQLHVMESRPVHLEPKRLSYTCVGFTL